jgi:hypothetical protein
MTLNTVLRMQALRSLKQLGWAEWGESEPKVISAWVEVDSLLADLKKKKNKVMFNYH